MATSKTLPMTVPWNLAEMLARIANSLEGYPLHQGAMQALARTAAHLHAVNDDPARLAEFCRLYQIPTPEQYMDAVLKQEAADRDAQEHVTNLEQRLAEIDAAAAAKRAKRHAAAAARRAAKVRARTKLTIAPEAARPAPAAKAKAKAGVAKSDAWVRQMTGLRRAARREAQRRYRAKKRAVAKT